MRKNGSVSLGEADHQPKPKLARDSLDRPAREMFSSFSPSAEAHRLVIHHRLNLTIRPVEHTASSRRFADCSAGVVHPSRQVCCNATCGLCGGHGCSGRPGGPRECCMPAILRTGQVCESRAAVACILRGSSNYIRGDGVEHRGSSGEGFPRAPPPPLPSPQAHAQAQTNLGTNVTPALSHDVGMEKRQRSVTVSGSTRRLTVGIATMVHMDVDFR